MTRLVAATLIVGLPFAVSGQETASYNHLLGASYSAGHIFQTNDFVRGDNGRGRRMSGGSMSRLEYGWQTYGVRDWEIAHRLPSFGVGVGASWFDNSEEVGMPVSVYGFYNGVFGRWGNGALRYRIEAGVAMNWEPYDYVANRQNIAIGSRVTAHVALGVEYAYTLADRWVLSVGGGVNHFSNGAVRKPNKGLNILYGQVRLAYLLSRQKMPPTLPEVDRPKGNEIDLTVGYGLKRFEVDTWETNVADHYDLGARYNAVTLQGTYLHRYSHKGKYGGGLQVLYDDFMGSRVKRDAGGHAVVSRGNVTKRIALAAMVAHEFCIARLAVVTHVGCYLYRPTLEDREQVKKKLFQRVGLKYTLPCNLHAGVNIYAHKLSVADFIEWNVGYSFHLRGTSRQ